MKNEIIKIAEDLRNGAINTETARTLLLGLFGVSGSGYEGLDAVVCPKCGSTDIMMPMVGFHEKDKCMECGERF